MEYCSACGKKGERKNGEIAGLSVGRDMEAESSSSPVDLMMIKEPDHVQVGFILRLHHKISRNASTSPRGHAGEEDHGVDSSRI